MAAALTLTTPDVAAQAQTSNSTPTFVQPTADLSSRRLTPEALWSMGRIGDVSLTPDGKQAFYSVTYYSIEKNKSQSIIRTCPTDGSQTATTAPILVNAYSPTVMPGGQRIAYMSAASGTMQVWSANLDGSDARQMSDEAEGIDGYRFSPDGNRVILVKSVPQHHSIAAKEPDLPLSSGMVINDLMYKHWDQYVTAVPHPFVARVVNGRITEAKDMLEGEPYECPSLPFGGVEELAWDPTGTKIAYSCRKKVGVAYAVSTDSDIFLYDVATGKTTNLCKPEGFVAPDFDPTRTMEDQPINHLDGDYNVGYDQQPQFSPDGEYIAWTSMARDGYESDRTRLCVLHLASGRKTYVTESFESGVNEFAWADDSRTLYFTGVWHGRTNVYRTNLEGKVQTITDDVADYALVGCASSRRLVVKRHSMSRADEIFAINLDKKGRLTQVIPLTAENKPTYDALDWGEVRERWVKTTDGKEELCWVVYPPQFDPNKKYPTLLFCEGGPQSPVSQFWSYRWNFQIMAANGYIVIAPNRRGLPGFGMEWLESISGDYPGQCMRDYLSAIDDIAKEPYVDRERLGAVGASFGGYSVYWLAGNHDKRFKCFISHDGIFNTQQQYVETEEMWFANWDLKSAPWLRNAEGQMQRAFAHSPHLYVDRWDTPILCIHGQKDFRIEYTQAQSAFSAARLRGIDAQLLLFPDENHWVLKPQNGILWQRTFFRWLDRWLKK